MDEYHGTGRDQERFDGIQEDGCQLLQTSVFYSDNFDTLAFSSCRDASREGLVADNEGGRVVVHVEVCMGFLE